MTGTELRALRRAAGLTQQQLGERLGIEGPRAQVAVSRWESGARGITPPVAIGIRSVLGNPTP